MVGGLLALLDDIAMLLDDVAVVSKVAAKKTATILGDDIAVSAEQSTNFRSSRELPVLWAITKGSFVNKLIILPFAFLLSAFAPFLIVPILLIGGIYLSFEAVEKIAQTLLHSSEKKQRKERVELSQEAYMAQERVKIQSAIKTDFILSIEIVMITLGSVSESTLLIQIIATSLIAIGATIGVYGLVAMLVRLDDVGYLLIEKGKKSGLSLLKRVGMTMVLSLPYIIRFLGVIGTIAMLLVGGGMFVHNIQALHHLLEPIPLLLGELIVGIIVGTIAYVALEGYSRIRGR